MKTPLIFLALATSAFAGAPVLARITPEALAKLQKNSPDDEPATTRQG